MTTPTDDLAQALERTARHRAASDGIDPDQWRAVLFAWEKRALEAHDSRAQPASVADRLRAAYTPEQWDEIQEATRRMLGSMRKLSDFWKQVVAAPQPPAKASE